MASYKVLAVSFDPEAPQNKITSVEFTFDDARKVTVLIYHTRPQSIPEMGVTIVNRGQSEWQKLVDIERAQEIHPVLEEYIGQSFPFSQTI